MQSKIKEIINKNNLPQTMVEILFKSLLSFNKTFLQLNKYPQNFLQKLFSYKIQQNCYYPIQTIQLRQLLKQNKIITNNKLLFYSYQFSKKYFNQYPILIQIKSIDNSVPFTLMQNQNIKINKIFINQNCLDKNNIQTIKNILKDFDFNNYGTIRQVKANSWYNLLKTAAPYNQAKLRNYMFKALYCHNKADHLQPHDLNYPVGQTPQLIQKRKQIKQTLQNFKNEVQSSPQLKNQLQQYISLFKQQTIEPNDINGDWLLNQLIQGNSEYQDIPQLKIVIDQFNKIKPKLQKRDLNQYQNYDQLKTAVDSIIGSVGKTVNPKLLNDHFTFIAQSGPYKLYKANDIEGVKEIGQISGSWCTRGSYQQCQAQRYFPNGIYQILKGDQLFAQASGTLDQITNLNNNTITQFDQDLKLLLRHIKTGFVNYITVINPEYKLTQEDIDDKDIFNTMREQAISSLVNGDIQYYNKINKRFNNKMQSITKDSYVINLAKNEAYFYFINNATNKFNIYNSLFNGAFNDLTNDKVIIQKAKRKADNHLFSGDINGFIYTNNLFNNKFSQDAQLIEKYGKKYPQLFNRPVTAFNFYSILKTADGTFNIGRNTEVKQFTKTQASPQYGHKNPQIAKSYLSKGDQVTLKTLGYAEQKPIGRVQNVIDNIAYVTWDKPVMSINGENKKVKVLKTKHDLLDLVGLGISIIKI